MGIEKFEKARLKYKPDNIKYLLIAEAPPKLGSDRFFYFEDVKVQDSLFLETMKVLYPSETRDIEIKEIRKNKSELLNKFKTGGFYLIDALDKPFEEKYSSSKKVKLIKAGQIILLSKIKTLVNKDTKVILISAPVFNANYIYLRSNDVNIIQNELVDFPGSGGQKRFREIMKKLIPLI